MWLLYYWFFDWNDLRSYVESIIRTRSKSRRKKKKRIKETKDEDVEKTPSNLDSLIF